MNRTTVYLSAEDLRRLAEEVELTGKKQSEIIRNALEWYFREQQRLRRRQRREAKEQPDNEQ